MYLNEKSIEEWKKIFKGLKSISIEVSESKEYEDDQKFLGDIIANLESILEGKTSSARNVERVMNLFTQHHYYDIKSGLELLKGINCSNLAELSKKIEKISKKSGLTGIALYSKDDAEFKERRTFINRSGYQRYFFTDRINNNVEYIDLLSNGENGIYMYYFNNNFIEDARRFDWNHSD